MLVANKPLEGLMSGEHGINGEGVMSNWVLFFVFVYVSYKQTDQLNFRHHVLLILAVLLKISTLFSEQWFKFIEIRFLTDAVKKEINLFFLLNCDYFSFLTRRVTRRVIMNFWRRKKKKMLESSNYSDTNRNE